MDLARVLAQLRSELENVDAAIQSLEKLQENARRRPGRPPSMLNRNNKQGHPRRGSKPPRRDDGKNKE